MSSSEHRRSWPARLGDPQSAAPELDPELQAKLRSVVKACADAPTPSEELTRRAARRAIDLVDSEPSVASGLRTWFAHLRPARIAIAVGMVMLVPFGLALASKVSPDSLSRLSNWLWVHRSVPPSALTPPRVEAPPPPSPSVAAPAPVGDAPIMPAPAVQPIARPQRPNQPHKASPAPTTQPSPEPTEDLLAGEAGLVSKAIALANDNPHASLDLLGRYWRRFPSGELRGEAVVAEIGAHLALRENAEALKRLDGLARDDFRGMQGTADELRVTRLELMAGAGRCGEALPSLGKELSDLTSRSRLRGRALLARAACKATTGDEAGNRADLRQYLTDFPNGPRAAQVRRVLGDVKE